MQAHAPTSARPPCDTLLRANRVEDHHPTPPSDGIEVVLSGPHTYEAHSCTTALKMTLREALTRATDQLSMHPELRPTALPDAALLLMHSLAIPRATLIAHPERRIEREDQARYQRFIERRLTFEPIQYITGEQEFYGLTLRVAPAVLIPRPETELLVEAVLAHLQTSLVSSHTGRESSAVHSTEPLRIVDIGTGSGAIAIALAHALPKAAVTGIDISSEALAVAMENARIHNLNIRFLQSDLLQELVNPSTPESGATGVENPTAWDVIVSNPPYIPDSDAPSLHPQVRDHEPRSALFSGPSGLEIYARLIPQAYALLKPDGLLALEIGHGQRDAIAALLTDWQDVAFINDLQQIPRVALARKPQ